MADVSEPVANYRSHRSVGEILRDVVSDAQSLMRGEVALVRAEMDQKIDRTVMALIWVVGGMLLGFAGLVILLMAGADALSYVIPIWAAYLVVGFIVAVLGVLFTMSGISMLKLRKLAPSRTARNLSADAQMVKEHT
jgi:drug/metabolite transporter (DMT)-like permease